MINKSLQKLNVYNRNTVSWQPLFFLQVWQVDLHWGEQNQPGSEHTVGNLHSEPFHLI
jgi:hypothetical protein